MYGGHLGCHFGFFRYLQILKPLESAINSILVPQKHMFRHCNYDFCMSEGRVIIKPIYGGHFGRHLGLSEPDRHSNLLKVFLIVFLCLKTYV